ncbi:MAG: hypothetical protein RL346_1390, partial [Verrucomicrobiota bacterium]
ENFVSVKIKHEADIRIDELQQENEKVKNRVIAEETRKGSPAELSFPFA